MLTFGDGKRQGLEPATRWTSSLGWFLASVVHMYAPKIAILGGGAVRAASQFLPAVVAMWRLVLDQPGSLFRVQMPPPGAEMLGARLLPGTRSRRMPVSRCSVVEGRSG